MDEFNRPNRSPNPEGRWTLFPDKGKPRTFTLNQDHQDLIDDLAIQASVETGKTVSRSDIVGAAIERAKGDVVAWIVGEVSRRDAEAAGTAEGSPPGAVPAAGP